MGLRPGGRWFFRRLPTEQREVDCALGQTRVLTAKVLSMLPSVSRTLPNVSRTPLTDSTDHHRIKAPCRGPVPGHVRGGRGTRRVRREPCFVHAKVLVR